MLDCPICLISLQLSTAQTVSLGCGHIFCNACVQLILEQPGETALCPNCRRPFDDCQVYPIFLPYAATPQVLLPAPPLSDIQVEVAQQLVEELADVGIESSDEGLGSVVTRAEAWTSKVLRTHTDTQAQSTINGLHESLQALRGRLRYSARLTSLKTENAQLQMENRDLKVERDTIIQRYKELVDEYQQQHGTAMEQLDNWAVRDKKHTDVETRLKDHLMRSRQKHKTALQSLKSRYEEEQTKLQDDLEAERWRTLKYKKRYLALRSREASRDTRGKGKRAASSLDSDLEIASDDDIVSDDGLVVSTRELRVQPAKRSRLEEPEVEVK